MRNAKTWLRAGVLVGVAAAVWAVGACVDSADRRVDDASERVQVVDYDRPPPRAGGPLRVITNTTTPISELDHAHSASYSAADADAWIPVPETVGAALDTGATVIDATRDFFNGTFLESFDALVTSDGATAEMTIEQSGGGDLTMRFSDGRTTLDCTPAATLPGDLTLGSDTSPTGNFVYIPQSTKVLTKSTSDWPAAEHIKIAYFLVPSATYVAANGAYINHNTNDHAQGTDGQGHLVHITERLRSQHAIYKSGVALTITIGGGTTVDAAVTAGVIYQMHKHATPALDTASADAILIINQNGAAYDPVTDLENLTNDASGVAVKKYFNWTFVGVGNKGGEYSPLMLNLPTGSYNQQASAESDVSGYDVLTIPSEFSIDSQTGFLIARVTMSKIGGTWAHVSTVDLRGATPQTVVGGVGGVDTEFSDNAFKLFNVSDNTKILDFQLSAITTGNTRTITMADADVDLGIVATAAAVITDDAVVRGAGGARGVQDSSVTILDTGVMSIPALGTGGYTDYDLKVGDVSTPSYGMIRIGNMAIGMSSYKAGNIDLDKAVLIRNIGGPATSQVEFVFAESTGTDCRFALAKSGVGNATYNPRSMLIAGPAPADTAFVTVAFWQAAPHNIFDNLACDTAGSGADLGVQNDLEVEGNIYVDTMLESTVDAGVTIESVELKDGLVDGVDVATAVIAAAVIADHAIVRGNGGARGVQSSGCTISDIDRITLPGSLHVLGDATTATAVSLEFKNTTGTGALTWVNGAPAGFKFDSALRIQGHIVDAAGLEILKLGEVASAVNEVTVTNAATTNPALITATGEANAALTIGTSGTGTITLDANTTVNDTLSVDTIGEKTAATGVTADGVLHIDNVIKLPEIAAAIADTAGSGQFWVKDTTPNQAWFTDDAGNDKQLAADIGCRVYSSTDQSIPDNTGTALSFNSERYDTDTMHDNSTNPTRITFTTAGKYAVGAAIRWAGHGTGWRQLGIRVNGSDQIAMTKMETIASATTVMQTVNTIFDFSATDYIEVVVRQTSTISIDIDAVAKFSLEAWAQLLAGT